MRLAWKNLALAVVALAMSASGEVRVWQGTLTLPTYEEDLPDPNPPFDQFTTSRFNYPYALRTNLTSRRVNHAWRAVYLENEYLKCSVLPDIGGHLYTCIDKVSGQSMFYNNPSIKKAAISYRGAWAAFGVEFNFPVSHNWVSMSPVSFALGKHDDGSAWVAVGNIDRVYGMEWSVELVLRPKSTLLEERVSLSNRSDARHRFYWWNNAGVNASDETQIVYPMRFAATHGFTEIHPWPVDTDGIDYSLLRNHRKGPVSMFAHGSREPFMGVWDPKINFGTVHFAPYENLPAKKIWSWGVDADGLDWRKALSDNDSAYLEVQGGLFRNQETYAFLEPRQVISFSEYWMPVRSIGGISRANLAGVASLIRQDQGLLAGFNANQAIPQASISIRNGDQVLYHEKQDLVPDHAWTYLLKDAHSSAKYTLEIRDAQGRTLLQHTEGKYEWLPESEIQVGPQPAYRIPEAERRSADDWIQLGKDDELNGRLLRALSTYQDALGKFPDSFSVQKAAGRLSAQLLRFDEAKAYLEPLHLRDTSDPEISYYLGLAYDGLGDAQHAQDSYEQAERLPTLYSAASLRLGELLARKGDLSAAQAHLANAVRTSPEDVRAYEELVAVENANRQVTDKEGSVRFPLSYFLQEEAGQPDLMQLANDPERVLNIAAQYMRLGLYQKALAVLSRKYPPVHPDQSEPGTIGPNLHPLVAYFRGYCREKLGQAAVGDYAAAMKLSTAYVFPSTGEELMVLKTALNSNPMDGTAHYLLGTFYFSRGLTDAALSEWAAARKFARQLPVLSADTGLALLHIKNDPSAALGAFREGMQYDPDNIANYIGTDQALSLLNRPPAERVRALASYPKLAVAPSGLIYELILNLSEGGDFAGAEKLFHNRFFAREEGGTNVRQVWIEFQLQRASTLAQAGNCTDALSTVEKLGAAVPDLTFTHDGLEPILTSARTRYLRGAIYEICNQPEAAKTNFEVAASASSPDELHWAWLAGQKLPNPDLTSKQARLQAGLEQAQARTETSAYPGWWFYTAGMLQRDLGQSPEQSFKQALRLPDRMLSYHYTRLAMSEVKPQ